MTAIAAASPHLVIGNVSKRFGATTVLDRIDLTIGRGELATLLGPSGCGKTTLLRIMAGLAQPDNGPAELAGRARAVRNAQTLCAVSTKTPQPNIGSLATGHPFAWSSPMHTRNV